MPDAETDTAADRTLPERIPPYRILIIGAGVMGRGQARLFARHGMAVTIMDRPDKDAPEGFDGVTGATDFPDETPDLIIENVPENRAIKAAVLKRIEDRYLDTAPVIATNTSGLPLEELAAGLDRPDRFVATHFFQPAESCPVVEVSSTGTTSVDAMDRAVAILEAAGRHPLRIERPIPGYVAQRLQHALYHEAYYLIEQGAVRPEDIDLAAKQLLGPRLCIAGMLEQKDISGVIVHALAQQDIVPHLAPREPRAFLKALIDANDNGVRAERGFYRWPDRDPDAVASAANARLSRLLDWLGADATAHAAAHAPGPSRIGKGGMIEP